MSRWFWTVLKVFSRVGQERHPPDWLSPGSLRSPLVFPFFFFPNFPHDVLDLFCRGGGEALGPDVESARGPFSFLRRAPSPSFLWVPLFSSPVRTFRKATFYGMTPLSPKLGTDLLLLVFCHHSFPCAAASVEQRVAFPDGRYYSASGSYAQHPVRDFLCRSLSGGLRARLNTRRSLSSSSAVRGFTRDFCLVLLVRSFYPSPSVFFFFFQQGK